MTAPFIKKYEDALDYDYLKGLNLTSIRKKFSIKGLENLEGFCVNE